jgi:type VI secretion system protein VasG
MPDKCFSLLDTAAARVAISQHSVPPALEDCRRNIARLETERSIIAREISIGIDAKARADNVSDQMQREQLRLEELEKRWKEERRLVLDILDLRRRLSDFANPDCGGHDGSTGRAVLGELRVLESDLGARQGEAPLILSSVDAQAVAAVVGDWTGIPVRRMLRNEAESVLTLGDTLARRVIGQDPALGLIARRVQTARAGLDNPARPVGVFLLCGPSGVGKTETALAIAEALFGGEENLITINMSEFQEAHTVSTLKGAPPGYVGYGEGGVLTEAVRRRPYSVVLLDEIEKAHPDVHEIFYQVFDKGRMEDGEGRLIDFRNTLILLTSNVGADLIMSMCRDPELMPGFDELAKALRQPLLQVFPPALLGRMVTVPYLPLGDAVLGDIIRLQLGHIAARISQRHQLSFSYEPAVVSLILSRCTEPESGGRMIDAILTNALLPEISSGLFRRLLASEPTRAVHIGVAHGALTYTFT